MPQKETPIQQTLENLSQASNNSQKEGQDGYTLEDIAKHTDEDDCWLAVYDKVYDITDFLYDHPGGPPVLLGIAGKDGTKQFE